MFKMAKKILAIDGNKGSNVTPGVSSSLDRSSSSSKPDENKHRSGSKENSKNRASDSDQLPPHKSINRPPMSIEELNDFSKLEDDPRLPLSVRQIFKITKSWKAIARATSKTGTVMFLNLFEQNKDLFYLFDRFQHLKGKDLHESMELREHAATVMSTLDQSINLLSDYDNFVAYLHSIGKLHRKVPDFKREHFWKIEQPFLTAVKQTLDERCNETIEQIYKIAIKLIIETIAEGYIQDGPIQSTAATKLTPSSGNGGGGAGSGADGYEGVGGNGARSGPDSASGSGSGANKGGQSGRSAGPINGQTMGLAAAALIPAACLTQTGSEPECSQRDHSLFWSSKTTSSYSSAKANEANAAATTKDLSVEDADVLVSKDGHHDNTNEDGDNNNVTDRDLASESQVDAMCTNNFTKTVSAKNVGARTLGLDSYVDCDNDDKLKELKGCPKQQHVSRNCDQQSSAALFALFQLVGTVSSEVARAGVVATSGSNAKMNLAGASDVNKQSLCPHLKMATTTTNIEANVAVSRGEHDDNSAGKLVEPQQQPVRDDHNDEAVVVVGAAAWGRKAGLSQCFSKSLNRKSHRASSKSATDAAANKRSSLKSKWPCRRLLWRRGRCVSSEQRGKKHTTSTGTNIATIATSNDARGEARRGAEIVPSAKSQIVSNLAEDDERGAAAGLATDTCRFDAKKELSRVEPNNVSTRRGQTTTTTAATIGQCNNGRKTAKLNGSNSSQKNASLGALEIERVESDRRQTNLTRPRMDEAITQRKPANTVRNRIQTQLGELVQGRLLRKKLASLANRLASNFARLQLNPKSSSASLQQPVSRQVKISKCPHGTVVLSALAVEPLNANSCSLQSNKQQQQPQRNDEPSNCYLSNQEERVVLAGGVVEPVECRFGSSSTSEERKQPLGELKTHNCNSAVVLDGRKSPQRARRQVVGAQMEPTTMSSQMDEQMTEQKLQTGSDHFRRLQPQIMDSSEVEPSGKWLRCNSNDNLRETRTDPSGSGLNNEDEDTSGEQDTQTRRQQLSSSSVDKPEMLDHEPLCSSNDCGELAAGDGATLMSKRSVLECLENRNREQKVADEATGSSRSRLSPAGASDYHPPHHYQTGSIEPISFTTPPPPPAELIGTRTPNTVEDGKIQSSGSKDELNPRVELSKVEQVAGKGRNGSNGVDLSADVGDLVELIKMIVLALMRHKASQLTKTPEQEQPDIASQSSPPPTYSSWNDSVRASTDVLAELDRLAEAAATVTSATNCKDRDGNINSQCNIEMRFEGATEMHINPIADQKSKKETSTTKKTTRSKRKRWTDVFDHRRCNRASTVRIGGRQEAVSAIKLVPQMEEPLAH